MLVLFWNDNFLDELNKYKHIFNKHTFTVNNKVKMYSIINRFVVD